MISRHRRAFWIGLRSGVIHLSSSSPLTLGARGDFAGVIGDRTGRATTLSFNNQTSPISGLQSIGSIAAQDSVSNVTVSDGIGSIAAASVSNVTTETDPNAPNTPLSITLSTDTPPTGLVLGNQTPSVYQVNAANALTSITDADGNVTTVQYDASNNPTSVANTLGTWTFQYDVNANVAQEVSPTGVTRTLTYNSNNAVLTDKALDANGGTIQDVTFTRNSDGQALTEADASGNTYTFTYTASGQVQSATDANGITLNYVYNTNGNVTQVTDTAGGETDYTYNNQNQLVQQVSTAPGQSPLVVTFTYTTAGDLATETRFGDLGETNILSTSQYTTNANHQVTELKQLDGSGNVLEDYVYTYNVAGQVASETRNGTVDASYSYDVSGQVLSDVASTYTYDANGNRNTAGYVIGVDNTLQSDGTWNYQYDAAGEVTSKTNPVTGETWTYTYALNGQFATATNKDVNGTTLQQVSFAYNPAGQLVEEDVTTPTGTTVTKFLWSGTQLYATLDGNGTITSRIFTVNGGNQLLGTSNTQGQLSLDLTDPLGSVRDVVGPAGTVHTDYSAFGTTVNGTSQTGLFGWGGMMHDGATGLYQGTLAREYDPSTGRWTSPDFAGQQIGVTNLYVYANNQTTSHTDVTGLWWLADAWNATSNYVSNAASSAAQAVTNAFRTVVTAAGDFAAKAVETLKDGANAITWLTTEAGKQLMVLGNQAVDAALIHAPGEVV